MKNLARAVAMLSLLGMAAGCSAATAKKVAVNTGAVVVGAGLCAFNPVSCGVAVGRSIGKEQPWVAAPPTTVTATGEEVK